MMRNLLSIAASLLLAVMLGGCAGPPKDYFYTLSAAQPDRQTAVAALPDVHIAVARVAVPEMVDRPQLVLRVAPNQVTLLEQRRWAQPLRSQIARVVAANLGQLLGTAAVSAYPQDEDAPAYRVSLDVRQFESKLGEAVDVELGWNVRRLSDGAMKTGRSALQEPATGGYDALPAAHSRALAAASRDIAAAIAELAATEGATR